MFGEKRYEIKVNMVGGKKDFRYGVWDKWAKRWVIEKTNKANCRLWIKKLTNKHKK